MVKENKAANGEILINHKEKYFIRMVKHYS